MIPNLDTLEQRIANVVQCSLQYLDNVSDHMSLAESHIKYPLVEFLERKKQCKEIELEVPMKHFYYRRHDASFICDDQQVVMEFKYLRDEQLSEHATQRIFDDLLRLRYALDDGYSKALMLICGHSENFIPVFLGNDKVKVENAIIQEHVEGVAKETEPTQLAKWFPMDQANAITVNFDNDNAAFFEDFEKRYIKHYQDKATIVKPYNPTYVSNVAKNISLTLSLKTSNIVKVDNSYSSYIVSIWEVSK